MAIWYILWSFGIFFTVLVFYTKKNLATLGTTQNSLFLRALATSSTPNFGENSSIRMAHCFLSLPMQIFRIFYFDGANPTNPSRSL
jgi:hypothetical protein